MCRFCDWVAEKLGCKRPEVIIGEAKQDYQKMNKELKAQVDDMSASVGHAAHNLGMKVIDLNIQRHALEELARDMTK